MEINPFSHNETRLLVINNEIVQITFKLHNESDNSYIENNDLQDEIKRVIIAFVKFMDEDHIVDGEGYYLLCKKSIWNFGKNYVFYRNDQVIPPHQYKYNFELEFANQIIDRNFSHDRGKNKSITDRNKKNNYILREVSLDDNFGTPKSSNNAINQEMIQRMSSRANISPLENWNMRQGVTATEFNLPFDNRQSMSRFSETTPTAIWANRQRSMDNAYITPFDNQRQVQKPVDSAYATLFNYRGPIQRSAKNAYMTPIDDRGQKFATFTRTSSFTNREYPESIQQSNKNLLESQKTLNNVSGTSRNPILVGETFEQTSRASSIGLSQESFIGGNWPSLETTLSLDSGSQKVSGISKSQFHTPTRQISSGTDDPSINAFGDGEEPSMQNAADDRLLNERDNIRETNGNTENNDILSLLSPLNFIRRVFSMV
ncbi:hypothetical protein C1645_759959 [Glomus cerebriforme]|uniref:Uncharacterized protein n=1 Tax=Glomus cerebriforme TaxID=658196 RepID=A0A397THV1_9GLOM|nr:hypothetical protein C1645_759959 [Glomus cerebriforme]